MDENRRKSKKDEENEESILELPGVQLRKG
jgi:hypothetical protein